MPGRSKTVRTDGKLNLKWTSKHGGGDQITCESICSTENGPNSQALARLYYYDGIYTTHPKPGAAPAARVWQNPIHTLALDRAASPVSGEKDLALK